MTMFVLGVIVGAIVGGCVAVVVMAIIAAVADHDITMEEHRTQVARLQRPSDSWPDWWPKGVRRD